MSLLSGIGLFKGIMAKMDWLDQNQRTISQNIANADTPGYRPTTLKEMDFKSLLGDVSKGKDAMHVAPVALEATDAQHFGAAKDTSGQSLPVKKEKYTYESSPDGNGVVLEEQLFKANENSINYQIATDLYRRNVAMLRMVVGDNR